MRINKGVKNDVNEIIPKDVNRPIDVVITICGKSLLKQSINLIKSAVLFTNKRVKFTIFAENANQISISKEVIIMCSIIRCEILNDTKCSKD